MELISTRPLIGVQELKQELFLRAEELERLVAIYKLKLCGEEMASLNYDSKLMQQSTKDVLDDQRGQFYDVYMRKREAKLREEWQARGAEKEEVMRAMMENLDSTSSTLMKKGKATEAKNDHSKQTNSTKLSSSSFTPSSTFRSLATTTNNPSIRSLQRSVARSQSSNERLSLVKDIKARKSQSLRKNSVSLGEPKDFIHLNYNADNLTKPMNTNSQRSGAPKPLLRKSNGIGSTSGISKAKVRTQAPISKENQLQESAEMIKEGNEQVDSMRNEYVQKLRFSKESWESPYHRFVSSSQFVESPKSSNSQIQIFLPDVHEASDFDSSVDSPCFDPEKGDLHKMNQCLDGKTVRVRKKWGSLERPFVAVDASTHPITDVTKGIKRFLKFGKRSGAKEDNQDFENYTFENPKNSSIEQIPSFGNFHEIETHYEQVYRPHDPNHSASLKEKEKHPFANSLKQRVLSSLPPFHVREKENKNG